MPPREMNIARSVAALRAEVARWRDRKERVGLVPTMGAVHAGHLALVQAAHAGCDRVVASLFVNPKQFAPSEDFASYPRTEEADLAAFAAAGIDLVFIPAVKEMYPPGFATSVRIGTLGEVLEGAHRPGFFTGVATVVAKLLLQCLPDGAYFGEKDYQQLLVVRRLARDLDIPTRIEGVPTVREPDGLALSSRNVYLSPEERRLAPLLHQTLRETAAALIVRPEQVSAAVQHGIATLQRAGFTVDYFELCDAATLDPLSRFTGQARLLAAARLGKTRLIDNIELYDGP